VLPDRSAWIRLVDGGPRPWDAVVADLDAARRAGAADLLLGGGEPTASPDLLKVLQRARAEGLRAAVLTDGQALGRPRRLDALRDAGATHVAVRLHAPDEAGHDAIAGRGSWARATATLRALAGHALSGAVLVVLDATTDVDAFVALARELGVALRLVPSEGPPPPDAPPLAPAVAAALDRAWRSAARTGVQLDVDGFAGVPAPVDRDLDPPLLDRNLAELFDRAFLPASASTGVRALPDDGDPGPLRAAIERAGPLPQLGPALAAAGAPPVDLPACLGGLDWLDPTPRAQQPGCAPCPRADRCPGAPRPVHDLVTLRPPPIWTPLLPRRVAVLTPWIPDLLLATSALPALVHALRARGVDADLLGRWDLTFDPHDLAAPPRPTRLQRAAAYAWRTLTRGPDRFATYTPPPDRHAHPYRGSTDEVGARAIDDAWWATLDLSPYDLVVAPDWDAGARAFEHPTLGPDARLVIADFHMLVGAEPWVRRRTPPGSLVKHGAWWPGDRVRVHACFPRFQGLYRAMGVPLSSVLWRPYPVWSGHVPAGPPPHTADAIFSGGRHARDFDTLADAARRLRGRVHPIRVNAPPGSVAAPEPPLVDLGMASLPDFVTAIRTSRFVVLPLRAEATHAAGISVIALAQAAGRPVIATRTAATLDHVRDGVDGLLVEPNDPGALADAIARLDRDRDLLAHLSLGAHAAGGRASVERWASELVHGPAPRSSVPAPGAPGGTRYAW
jgi:hypothetical protein